MRIEVDIVEKAIQEMGEVASRFDGLIADTEFSRYSSGSRGADISVRVPSLKFDDAMAAFRKLGDVEWEKIATQDTTKAYADLETRLSVKRETEKRLRDILSSRPGKLSDVLDVERELSRVTGEIEQLLGEKRYYDHRVSISLIQLYLYEADSRHWTFVAPVEEALSNSARVLLGSISALIYLVVFLLPWLVVGIPAWWLIKRLRRGRSGAADPA